MIQFFRKRKAKKQKALKLKQNELRQRQLQLEIEKHKYYADIFDSAFEVLVEGLEDNLFHPIDAFAQMRRRKSTCVQVVEMKSHRAMLYFHPLNEKELCPIEEEKIIEIEFKKALKKLIIFTDENPNLDMNRLADCF